MTATLSAPVESVNFVKSDRSGKGHVSTAVKIVRRKDKSYGLVLLLSNNQINVLEYSLSLVVNY